MVLMLTQEDATGKAAPAAAKALFFKNVRLLSMEISPIWDGEIRSRELIGDNIVQFKTRPPFFDSHLVGYLG